MWLVSLCAGLAVIESALTDKGASLIIALTAVVSALISELLIDLPRKGRTLKDGSAVASALILTLLLPNHIHPVLVIFGAAFAMVVVKHSFGGLGANWVNPALGGWLFMRFSWPAAFNAVLEDAPFLGAGPAVSVEPVSLLDGTLTSFLNRTIFSLTGSAIPNGYIDLFVPSGPGFIADRGLLGLLAGTIIITASQVNRAWVSACYLGILTLLIRMYGDLPSGGPLGNGDILLGLFSGGTIAAAFLLMGDTATGAKSFAGVTVSVVLAAVLTFLFRYQGQEGCGAFYAVLLINALVPFIRDIESKQLYSQNQQNGVALNIRRSFPGSVK
jgi:electron transport complex protein RnfD